MTIVLDPDTEALVREEAARQGREINAVVEALIKDALARSTQEFEETVAGIERGWSAAEEGRERPLREYAADVRPRSSPREGGNGAGER